MMAEKQKQIDEINDKNTSKIGVGKQERHMKNTEKSFLMGYSRTIFLYFRLFNTDDSNQMFNKFCR